MGRAQRTAGLVSRPWGGCRSAEDPAHSKELEAGPDLTGKYISGVVVFSLATQQVSRSQGVKGQVGHSPGPRGRWGTP